MAGCCGGEAAPSVLTLLRGTPFYAYLDDNELQVLAQAFVRRRVAAGRLLPESPFYILLSGAVEVRRRGVTLCRKRDGAFFSRQAGLLDDESPSPNPSFKDAIAAVRSGKRSSLVRRASTGMATATARLSIMLSKDKARRTSFHEQEPEVATEFRTARPTELLVMQPEMLSSINDRSPAIAGVIHTMEHANLERYLSKVPFIKRARLSGDQMRTLGELGSYLTRDVGSTLFSQGDPGDAFYVVLHGSVEVWVDRSVDAPTKLKHDSSRMSSSTDGSQRASVLGPGDHIGESALVVEGDRSATVKVVERSIFFVLEKSNFGAFLQVAPSLEQGIYLHTKERLLQVYRQMRVPFFAELSDAKIQTAAKHAVLEHYDPGSAVCRKDEEGKAFYVVVTGKIEVLAGDTSGETADPAAAKEHANSAAAGQGGVFVLSPGQYFGEISMLLQDQLVTATCTAPERSTLLALPRMGFTQLFEDEPELAAYMRIKILRKHSTLLDTLQHQKSRKLFHTFLKGEYADESLLFYDDALTFKSRYASRSDAERQAAAKALVDEYLPDGAPHQINIPSQCLKRTMASVGDGTLNEGSFEDARTEVYQLMAKDSLPRFMATPVFAELLQSFGSYDMELVISSESIELDLELMAA